MKIPNTLIDCGTRPAFLASSRIIWIRGARICGDGAETKTPSACFDPNAIPAGEVPAWKRKGVRCGDGSRICGPSTWKFSPWWCTNLRLLGSVYTPVWESSFSAESDQLPSQSLDSLTVPLIATVMRVFTCIKHASTHRLSRSACRARQDEAQPLPVSMSVLKRYGGKRHTALDADAFHDVTIFHPNRPPVK